MSELQPPDDSWHEHFEMRPDASRVLGNIALQGPERLVVIADWDGVVTDKDPDGVNGTTWGILRDHMPTDDAKREHKRLYSHYHPLEKAGTLTPSQAERWQRLALRLMTGASLSAIRQSAEDKIVLRRGVSELLSTCAENDVPFVIKSTGSSEIIEAVLAKNDLRATGIFSNRFRIGDDGDTIEDIQRGTLTHSLNKHVFSHRTKLGQRDRTSAIVVGDNLHDVHMVRDPAVINVFRIRLDGGRDYHVRTHGQEVWEEYVADSFRGNFNAVANDSDMIALEGLVSHLSTHNHRAA